MTPIEFNEKQPPQKALCLGPTPPPLAKVQNYRFFMFFYDFWAFNRAGKSVTKIGIYALPPLKSGRKCHFLAILSIFTNFSIIYHFMNISSSISSFSNVVPLIYRDPIYQSNIILSHHRQH
jgi:hypothetical protein